MRKPLALAADQRRPHGPGAQADPGRRLRGASMSCGYMLVRLSLKFSPLRQRKNHSSSMSCWSMFEAPHAKNLTRYRDAWDPADEKRGGGGCESTFRADVPTILRARSNRRGGGPAGPRSPRGAREEGRSRLRGQVHVPIRAGRWRIHGIAPLRPRLRRRPGDSDATSPLSNGRLGEGAGAVSRTPHPARPTARRLRVCSLSNC
jgi:hypothetical protein